MDRIKRSESIFSLICKGIVDLHKRIESGQSFEYPYPKSLQKGYNKLTLLYLELAKTPPSSLVKLVNWCSNKSLSEWHLELDENAYQEDYLIEDGEPTEFCREWAELIDEDGDFQKELILTVMKKCKSLQQPDLYIYFRRMLIENPIVDFLNYNGFRNKIISLKEDLEKAYKEVDEIYFIDGQLYICDRCGYYMVKDTKNYLVCANKKCRKEYSAESKVLEGLKPFYVVDNDIHRYITIPGKAELDLEAKLKKISLNLKVELWTEYDAHDLYLTFPDGEKWAADVKDWQSPYALAKNINDKNFPTVPEWNKAFYVIPDRRIKKQEDYLRVLKQKYNKKQRIEFISSSKFVSKVKRELGKK